jgi:hypothetical protein
MPVLDSLMSSFDATRAQLRTRLDGLSDDEYLWEPVDSMWTVRLVETEWHADWADPDPVPAPVTTIAWRLWHIAVDALDSYSVRTFGTSGTGLSGTTWVGRAEGAVRLTDQAFERFADGFEAVGEEGLSRPLGDVWGSYSEASFLDLFLHAHREVTHHAAEIGLLRDLYAGG